MGCGGGGGGNPYKIIAFDPPSSSPGKIIKATCEGINQQSVNVSLEIGGYLMPVISYGDGYVSFITPVVQEGSYSINLYVDSVRSEAVNFFVNAIKNQQFPQQEFATIVSESIMEISELEKQLIIDLEDDLDLYSNEEFENILDALNKIETLCSGIENELNQLNPEEAKIIQSLFSEVGLLNLLNSIRDANLIERYSSFTVNKLHPDHVHIFSLDLLSSALTEIDKVIEFITLAEAVAIIVSGGTSAPIIGSFHSAILLTEVTANSLDYIIDTLTPTDFTDYEPWTIYPIEFKIIDDSFVIPLGESKNVSFVGHFRCQDNYKASTYMTIIEELVAFIPAEVPQNSTEEMIKAIKDLLIKFGIDVTEKIIKSEWQGDKPKFSDIPIEMDMSIYKSDIYDAYDYIFPNIDIQDIYETIFPYTDFESNNNENPSVILSNEEIVEYDYNTELIVGKKKGNTKIFGKAYCMVPIKEWNFRRIKGLEVQEWFNSPVNQNVVVESYQPPVWANEYETGIKSVIPGDQQITIDFWQATDPDNDNPVTYNLYYCDETATGDNNPFVYPYLTVKNITSPYQLTGLTNEHKYWLGVRAQDSKGLEETNTVTKYATPFSNGDFILVGSAQQIGDILRLTLSQHVLPIGQSGAAWYTVKQSIENGFEISFQFQITDGAGVGGGADGIAFVIQNSSVSALGSSGGAIGYATGFSPGISNSLAVEFDTFCDWFAYTDPDNNHISVQTAGVESNNPDHAYSIGFTNAIPNMKDGAVHSVKIEYIPGTLSIYLDDLITPVLSTPVNLADILSLDNGSAWIGFTSATGDGYEIHDIVSWSF